MHNELRSRVAKGEEPGQPKVEHVEDHYDHNYTIKNAILIIRRWPGVWYARLGLEQRAGSCGAKMGRPVHIWSWFSETYDDSVVMIIIFIGIQWNCYLWLLPWFCDDDFNYWWYDMILTHGCFSSNLPQNRAMLDGTSVGQNAYMSMSSQVVS